MRILFICTSNKDRSPALERYFSDKYPSHEFFSAGVNKYFCTKKGTNYLTDNLLLNSEIIVCAEDIHFEIIKRDFSNIDLTDLKIVKLNLGEYEQGNINIKYLQSADKMISDFFNLKRAK